MKTTEKTNWKNRLLAACAVCALLAAALLSVNVFAAGSYQDKDLPLGSSSEVLMVGEIEPTLMSVTVPSYVPFHISRGPPSWSCSASLIFCSPPLRDSTARIPITASGAGRRRDESGQAARRSPPNAKKSPSRTLARRGGLFEESVPGYSTHLIITCLI